MRKQIIIRLLDLVVLAMLLGPYQDARTFAVVLVSIMAVLAFLACLGMTTEIAEKLLLPRSPITFYVRVAFSAMYCLALIYSGHPVLASLYAIAAYLVVAAAGAKLDAQREKH